MGKYINVVPNISDPLSGLAPVEIKGKAKTIFETCHGQFLQHPPKTMSEIPAGKALICIVNNGPFEAAAWCCDAGELVCFADPSDRRPKTWILIPLDMAEKYAA